MTNEQAKIKLDAVCKKLNDAVINGDIFSALVPARTAIRKLDLSGVDAKYAKYAAYIVGSAYEYAFMSEPTLMSDKRVLRELYKDHDAFETDLRGLLKYMQAVYEEHAQAVMSGTVSCTYQDYYQKYRGKRNT